VSRGRKATNPFYVVLLIVATIFALTACAYGVMAVKMIRPDVAETGGASGSQLLQALDRYGPRVLMVELAILAVVTVGAIGTDEFWAKRAARAPLPGDHSNARDGNSGPL
jgi:hypothetical protein